MRKELDLEYVTISEAQEWLSKIKKVGGDIILGTRIEEGYEGSQTVFLTATYEDPKGEFEEWLTKQGSYNLERYDVKNLMPRDAKRFEDAYKDTTVQLLWEAWSKGK